MKLQARNFVVRKPETVDITALFEKFCIATRTRSVTVVDTISTTVIFYFPPSEERLLRKAGLFPNISGHRRDVRPDLQRPWRVSPELSKTAIVIRVETINDYFPYRNPPKAEMLLWALDGFSLIAVGQKEQKGQNRAGILSNSWYPYYLTGAVAFTGRHLLCAYVIIYEIST